MFTEIELKMLQEIVNFAIDNGFSDELEEEESIILDHISHKLEDV